MSQLFFPPHTGKQWLVHKTWQGERETNIANVATMTALFIPIHDFNLTSFSIYQLEHEAKTPNEHQRKYWGSPMGPPPPPPPPPFPTSMYIYTPTKGGRALDVFELLVMDSSVKLVLGIYLHTFLYYKCVPTYL